jgi:two-component system cell cycle response regulator DivK
MSLARAAGTVAARRSVLIVDDFEDGLELYREYLTFKGFEVHGARSGPEALELARLHHPGLILLDIRMPGMSGFDVAQSLRADTSFTNTPIVALTAHAMENELAEMRAAGFDDVCRRISYASLSA